VGGEKSWEAIGPLDEDDPTAIERIVEPELARIARRLDAKEIEMFHWRRSAVAMPERKRGACDVGVDSERADDRGDEGRLSRAEFPTQSDNVARSKGGCERTCEPLEGVEIVYRGAERRQKQDVPDNAANLCDMWLRANDALVGVITGICAAVIAALFEAVFVAQRFLSLGANGGGVGSKIIFIAIVGAIVGGIVGFFVGAVIKPRPQIR